MAGEGHQACNAGGGRSVWLAWGLLSIRRLSACRWTHGQSEAPSASKCRSSSLPESSCPRQYFFDEQLTRHGVIKPLTLAIKLFELS